MWEPVALCCFSRRTGCLVLGSLHVTLATIVFIVGMAALVLTETVSLDHFCSMPGTPTKDCLDFVRPGHDNILGIMIFYAVASIVFSSLMIHGVRTNNHRLMAPFLIKNTVILVLQIILNSIGIIIILVNANSVIAYLVMYFCGTSLFMTTYFLLTVRAYYYELKRGKTEDRHRLVEQSD